MQKKIITISFLLLANLVLLVHVVLPHHHHGAQICINLTHCNHSDDSCDSHSDTCTHNHNSDGSATNCVLKQLVVIPAGHLRIEPVFFNVVNPEFNAGIQPDRTEYMLLSQFFRINYFPHSVPLYKAVIVPQTGLRAPPAV